MLTQMSWNDLPGLGTATGTRVDSAAKHIMACKVDYHLLAATLSDTRDPINALHNEKMKYCMHKDEIVLNTTSDNPALVTAYPMVVTTLGDIDNAIITVIKHLYKQNSPTSFFDVQRRMKVAKNNSALLTSLLGDKWKTNWETLSDAQDKDWHTRVVMQLSVLPNFRCQGVALGQAWASYLSGDNVASVLVGGMVTVMNGHFTMHTGDLVQWYFDFEKGIFDQGNKMTHAERVPENNADANAATKDPRNIKREKYLDERLYGNSSKTGRYSGQKNADTVVRIKPYKMYRLPTSNGDGVQQSFFLDHYGDKVRVFAKCISGGRPFDAVDIMLMTQSL